MAKVAYQILQIDYEKNPDKARAMVDPYVGNSSIDFNGYEISYQGELGSESSEYDEDTLEERNEMSVLEDLFRIFNIEHPDDFDSYSLSVGDIVVLNGKSYYLCMPIGWEKISVPEHMVKEHARSWDFWQSWQKSNNKTK